MNSIIDILLTHLKDIQWDGPAIFVVIILAVTAVFRKWSMLLLIILTVVLSWGAQDLIITNLESEQTLISVPFIIYCIGGGTIILLALISFFKSSI